MVDERHERLKKILVIYTKKITASPSDARNALIREGIYNEAGKLNKNYTLTTAEKR